MKFGRSVYVAACLGVSCCALDDLDRQQRITAGGIKQLFDWAGRAVPEAVPGDLGDRPTGQRVQPNVLDPDGIRCADGQTRLLVRRGRL